MAAFSVMSFQSRSVYAERDQKQFCRGVERLRSSGFICTFGAEEPGPHPGSFVSAVSVCVQGGVRLKSNEEGVSIRRGMAIVITKVRRALIAMTLAALSTVAAAAEPNNAADRSSSLPSEASRGDALVPPVKRMAPQMPENVAAPAEKPNPHKHKHKAKKKRH